MSPLPPAPRPRAAGPQRGFSLVELMAVVLIIGLLLGTFTLTLNLGGDDDDQLVFESERLLQLIDLAEDRAVLTGEPIGLALLPPDTVSSGTDRGWRYRWYRYRAGQWGEAEEPLVERQLPEGLELSLELEGQEVDLTRLAEQASLSGESEGDEEDEEQQPSPAIVFYPGGEVSPFVLTLFDAEAVDRQERLGTRRTGRVGAMEPEGGTP